MAVERVVMAGPEDIQVFAVIPAAGQSRRMGEPKQLLPMDGATMLESVIESVLEGGIDGLCVVTSRVIDEALLLSEDPRFILAHNDDPASEMIDSIRIGMNALADHCTVCEHDGLMVCPADMPGVTSADVRTVAGAYREAPGGAVIAAYQGKRGHPVVFPASWAEQVRQIGDGGLKVLIERHSDRARLVECASPGVLVDLDTLQDFDEWVEGS
ncbi:MAG: nucleotidyltransferase family protein [bacterium]|nr:nucleotidyltransferase family protein [bacterium]